MIPKIQNSPRFKEDYNNFQKQINGIDENDPLKKELTDALAQLKSNVGFIDRCHEQMFINGKISSEVSELREEVAKLKTLLEQKLASYNRLHPAITPEPHPNVE